MRARHIWGVSIFGASLMLGSLAHSEEFLSQVWTYEAYKNQSTNRSAQISAFEETVNKTMPPKSAKMTGDPLSIVIVYPGKQVSDYWRRSQASFEARLKESGISYTIESRFTEPGSELRKQERYINDALKSNPDYLIFTLDALRHRTIVERIIARGQTKIILQNITTPVKNWEGFQPFLYVGFDHALGSRMIADYYIKTTGGKGRYGLLYGPPGYVSQMRGDTFIKHLSNNSSLELANTYYVGFNREKSRIAALDLLKSNPDLSFIYACSTDIALGAIDALKETGLLGKVMVNGWGGGGSELAAMAQGELDVTVMRMNDDNGVAMADAIILDQGDQSAAVPTVYSGKISLITSQTPKQSITALSTRAFRYSNP